MHPNDLDLANNIESDRVRYELLVRDENDAVGIHREALIVTSSQASITSPSSSVPDSIRLPFPIPNARAGDVEILRPSRSMLSPDLVDGHFPYKYLSRIICDQVRTLFLDSDNLGKRQSAKGPSRPDRAGWIKSTLGRPTTSEREW